MPEWLFEPLQFAFMQQALLIGVLVGLASGTLSCFLVLKGWSLMGDAVSHAVLPGIVLAHVAGIPIAIGAFAAGLLCAISTGYLTHNSRLKEDTVMGVVFSGLFALGIVLFTFIETDLHLDHILFGDMLGVHWRDVLITGGLCLVVTGLMWARRRDLALFVFDEQHASVVGINPRFLNYALLTLLSLVIVAALKAVGIILVIATLIAPGAIAYLLTDRFDTMLLLANLIAVVAALAGVYSSYFLDSAPAPTIVVILAALFVLAFLFAPKRGLRRGPGNIPASSGTGL